MTKFHNVGYPFRVFTAIIEFEGDVEQADSMTQLCSPSLEFFPRNRREGFYEDTVAGDSERRPLLQTMYLSW
jgi:hypothetical protein